MQLFRFEFKALGGSNELQFFAPEKNFAEQCFEKVVSWVKAFEAKYSRYREDSVVSLINNSAGLAGVEVDQETSALLDYAQICFEQSGGVFDLTSGVLRQAWDFKRAVVPSQEQIEELLPLIGWDKVEWRKPYIRLSKKGMQLDFGGLGKEYAVDQGAIILSERGVQHGLLNFAGDVRVIGAQPDGSAWSVGVVHPRKTGEVLGRLNLFKGALATSGDYERYFEFAGKRYCHILNPKTGWPCTGLQSVSVISDWCLMAGTASTIAMALGPKKGERFIRNLGLSAILVDELAGLSYIKMRGFEKQDR